VSVTFPSKGHGTGCCNTILWYVIKQKACMRAHTHTHTHTQHTHISKTVGGNCCIVTQLETSISHV
jgi:hypothetical protein